MNDETSPDINKDEAAAPGVDATKDATEETSETSAPSQDDPIDAEIKRNETNTQKRSKKEKLLYTKKRVEEQLAEFGDDEEEDNDEADDSTPLTKGDLKKFNVESARKKSVDLVSSIQDEKERKLTLQYLERIVPSGDAEEDVRLARLAVNSVRNGMVIEEIARKEAIVTKSHASAPGNPAPSPDAVFEPTEQEASLMRPPFNLTKEDILKARGQ